MHYGRRVVGCEIWTADGYVARAAVGYDGVSYYGHSKRCSANAQRSALTSGHKTILAALNLPEPARFSDFTVPTA